MTTPPEMSREEIGATEARARPPAVPKVRWRVRWWRWLNRKRRWPDLRPTGRRLLIAAPAYAHAALAWTTRALLALLTAGLLLAMTIAYGFWIAGQDARAIRLTAPLAWLVTHPPGWPLVVGSALAIGVVLFFQQIASFLYRLQKAGGFEAAPQQADDTGTTRTSPLTGSSPAKPPEDRGR